MNEHGISIDDLTRAQWPAVGATWHNYHHFERKSTCFKTNMVFKGPDCGNDHRVNAGKVGRDTRLR